MKSVIPFNKEILFKTNIAEISSISLEHDYELTDKEVKGNFIVSGDYKAHEVSVNKEPFRYSLPFAIDLDDNIDRETVSLDIEDFSYDFHKDVLEVKIEFSLCAERIKEEEREEVVEEESEFRDPVTLFGNENQTSELEELLADLEAKEQEQVEIHKEEVKEEQVEMQKEEMKEEIVEQKEEIVEHQEMLHEHVSIQEKEETLEEETKNMVMDSIDTKEEYVIYHVHILKAEETIESVCKSYDVSTSLVGEYNDLSTMEVGDKLIIPIYKDE